MKNSDNTRQKASQTDFDATPLNPPKCAWITERPGHPVHADIRLVEGVRSGNPTYIAKLGRRLEPFIDCHASDPGWPDVGTGRNHGIAAIQHKNYDCLRRWNPKIRTLTQQIQITLQKALTAELVRRRKVCLSDPRLPLAIEACRSDLSDTHYWILKKILNENVSLKQVPKYFDECAELRLASSQSVGSTYSRALRQFERVAPAQYQPLIQELLRTRKRSGR
jgi:hypothetical protein